jgi:hypothetical protein
LHDENCADRIRPLSGALCGMQERVGRDVGCSYCTKFQARMQWDA